jgi:hypothetical protein
VELSGAVFPGGIGFQPILRFAVSYEGVGKPAGNLDQKTNACVRRARRRGLPNTDAAALGKLVKRLRQAGSGPFNFCYEAGPYG